MKKYISIIVLLFIAMVGFSQSNYSYSLWSENIRGRSGNVMWWEGSVWFDGAVDIDSATIGALTVTDITISDTIDGNIIFSDTVTATHFIGNIDATTATIDTLTAPALSGDISFTGELNQTYAPTSGANVGNIFKTTLTAADSFTGTTGYQFKVYDADTNVYHSDEHCGVYVNMKLQKAPQAGGKSVLYSGHNYASAVEIDAGMWLYGKLEYGLKISGDTINYGIDLSETAVETADLRLENGATIANSSTGLTVVSDSLQASYLVGSLWGVDSFTTATDTLFLWDGGKRAIIPFATP